MGLGRGFAPEGLRRLAVENGQEDLLQVWASAHGILLEELQSSMNTGLLIIDSIPNSVNMIPGSTHQQAMAVSHPRCSRLAVSHHSQPTRTIEQLHPSSRLSIDS